MTPARYLATAFALFGALVVAAGLHAWTQMGRATPSGFANCAYIERKIGLASGVDSPKLVIIGGSNAAAGIDASAMAGKLRAGAFNFSLFATFSPGFDLFQAKKVLRQGDGALLAFEYLAYEYDKPTNALVDTVYSCGMDYWRSLDWPRRLLFVFAIRPRRYFSTLTFTDETSEAARRMADAAIAPDGNLGNPFPAPASELNAHQPLAIRFLGESRGVAEIADFVRWAKANGVTVFATWPNTLYFEEYETNPAFARIADFYRSLGVETIGTPRDAMVPPEYLAETIYHLTAPGIALRTGKLGEALEKDAEFSRWRERAARDITPE